MSNVIRLGTRGSALALWQANWVADRLRAAEPGRMVEIVVLKTAGDVRQDVPLSAVAGKGVFVREIEAALLRGDVDIAVHSAKDLPSTYPEGLEIAAFCERADARDALVSRFGTLAQLPEGAAVATGAPRRVSQLRHVRHDLKFVEIRGNVDTRLAKLERGDADALVLACAGLDRLGRSDVIAERLSAEVSLPQVGQACVAVQCRVGDAATRAAVAAACDHAPTRAAVTTERAFLALLGGGCTAPVAAHAVMSGERFRLTARVGAPDGSALLTASAEAEQADTDALASRVYRDLIGQGADALLASAPA